MSTIEIQKISIVKLNTDAIVNAANESLAAGGGVCGAIFQAAGHQKLQAACDALAHCDTGDAVITPGFALKAKYVIHAVGPRWKDGKHGEPERLRHAYKKALELAAVNHCRSVGFPLISAGIYGYPVNRAWDDAFRACAEFLQEHPEVDLHIIFAVLNDEILEAGKEAFLQSSASVYKIAAKEDWKTLDMPQKHDTFVLIRSFTPQQMKALRRGNIPQEMEDKWFWYMDGNTLYAHRSWTGFCVYRIEFKNDDHHIVIVNRDPEQYACTSVEADLEALNKLLNWWTQSSYDYYHEWLSETVDNLKKAGKIPDKLRIGQQEFDAIYFHKPEEPNGYLSNWYTSPFDLQGVHYTSVEQFIMYQKCGTFGDKASALQILDTNDTATQQAIGRKCQGYIDSVWAGMRQTIAIHGLLAKFQQNDDLRQKLLDTQDAFLVECAVSDRTWACGVSLSDDKRKDASNWLGKNILGFALMTVRSMLREGLQDGKHEN